MPCSGWRKPAPTGRTVPMTSHRRFEAECFLNAAYDLRVLWQVEKFRSGEPTASIIESRTLQSSIATTMTAHSSLRAPQCTTLSTCWVTCWPCSPHRHEQDRAQVFDLCPKVQESTGVNVKVTCADQGYTGEQTAQGAAEAGRRANGGQTAGGKQGVQPGTKTLGGRALLRVAVEIPSYRTRSGTTAVDASRILRPGSVRSVF